MQPGNMAGRESAHVQMAHWAARCARLESENKELQRQSRGAARQSERLARRVATLEQLVQSLRASLAKAQAALRELHHLHFGHSSEWGPVPGTGQPAQAQAATPPAEANPAQYGKRCQRRRLPRTAVAHNRGTRGTADASSSTYPTSPNSAPCPRSNAVAPIAANRTRPSRAGSPVPRCWTGPSRSSTTSICGSATGAPAPASGPRGSSPPLRPARYRQRPAGGQGHRPRLRGEVLARPPPAPHPARPASHARARTHLQLVLWLQETTAAIPRCVHRPPRYSWIARSREADGYRPNGTRQSGSAVSRTPHSRQAYRRSRISTSPDVPSPNGTRRLRSS